MRPWETRTRRSWKLPLESSVILTGTVAVEPRAPGGFELHGIRHRDRSESETSHRQDGARSGLSPGAPPPVAALSQADSRHALCATRLCGTSRNFFHENGFTLVDTPIFTTTVGEDSSKPLLRGLLRPGQDLSFPDRPALSRGRHIRAGQGVFCLGPPSARALEDQAPPHRVLDGGGRDWRFHGTLTPRAPGETSCRT